MDSQSIVRSTDIIIVEMLRFCIIKFLVRFPRIKLHNDGFDFFSSIFICVCSPNPMGTINIFILEWMIHFFVAFFYPLQDILFLSSSLHSIPWILRQLRLLDCSLSSYLIMSWSLVFAWMAIFPSSSLIFKFCSSSFSSNLEIISFQLFKYVFWNFICR